MLERSRIDDGPATVLVVNRDAGACELVARLIEHAGFQAERVTETRDAVDRIHAGVAAIVIDGHGTGEREALIVLEETRAAGDVVGDLATILLAETDAERRHAYEAGVDDVLVRPFHANDLVETVRATIGRSVDERARHRSEQLAGGRATT